MASQIIFVIASLCLWHQGSAQSSSSAVTVAATPSLQSASVNATPALQSSDMMSSTSSYFVITNQPVQPASTSAISGAGGSTAAAVASSAVVAPGSSAAGKVWQKCKLYMLYIHTISAQFGDGTKMSADGHTILARVLNDRNFIFTKLFVISATKKSILDGKEIHLGQNDP
eukprot:Seg1914.4 transcript_id=Seg1914.4/GoldUCD/mRNA.D3Y31 product="hypothetical protein" protein_id=Seg1914.4/GoldUCD/D3Y31